MRIYSAEIRSRRSSVIESPSDGVPEKAPRWDLTGTEACGSAASIFGVPSGIGGIYEDL